MEKAYIVMNEIDFSGNVIPHGWKDSIVRNTKWFNKKTEGSWKKDPIARIVLSEICYWYRPKIERKGDKIILTKWYKEDMLQKSYKQLSESLGLSKSQVTDSCIVLENLGLIKRHFRTVETKHGPLPNILFIEIFPGKVSLANRGIITNEEYIKEQGGITHLGDTPLPNGGHITENTTDNTNIIINNNIQEETSETLKGEEINNESTIDSVVESLVEKKAVDEASKPSMIPGKELKEKEMNIYNQEHTDYVVQKDLYDGKRTYGNEHKGYLISVIKSLYRKHGLTLGDGTGRCKNDNVAGHMICLKESAKLVEGDIKSGMEGIMQEFGIGNIFEMIDLTLERVVILKNSYMLGQITSLYGLKKNIVTIHNQWKTKQGTNYYDAEITEERLARLTKFATTRNHQTDPTRGGLPKTEIGDAEKAAWNHAMDLYDIEEIIKGVKRYINHIGTRSWSGEAGSHRFTLEKFLTSEKGLKKMLQPEFRY